MNKTKHSKFKNSGLIFELLVRKLTADTLSQHNSPSVKILKEFYVNTELSKEYKIYKKLVDCKVTNSEKMYSIIDTTLNESKKLNRSLLRSEKYNLIREIKEHYNLEDFFGAKINNYKIYASIYNLIEEHNSTSFTDPSIIIKNKETLIEHIASQSRIKPESNQLIDEYSNQSKDVRILAYKILLEKFNTKYVTLNNEQKTVLKEYINNVTESPKLRDFVNSKFLSIKKSLNEMVKKCDNQSVKIKINEVISLLYEIPKQSKVKDKDILNVLQYLELEKELKNIQ